MNCQSTVDPSITRAKRRAAQRLVSTVSSRFLIGLVAVAGLAWMPLPARAIDGCLLVLYQGAPDWRVIPECVPPMLKALDDLARGIPFPPCASAEEPSALHSRAVSWHRIDDTGCLWHPPEAAAPFAACDARPVTDIASWRIALPLSSDLVRP